MTSPANVAEMGGDVPGGLQRNGAAGPGPRHRGLIAGLLTVGAALTAGSVMADMVRPRSTPGIGLVQVALGLLGLVIAGQGIALRSAGAAITGHWLALLGSATGARARTFGVIALQVLLFVVAVRVLQIESPAFFQQIVPLVALGFLVHHALPHSQRLPFFVALSVGGIVLVAEATNAFWIVGIGLAVIAVCHLPVPFKARILGVVLIGTGLAFMRAGVIVAPWSAAVWPILASLLMFRLVVYLYDLSHVAERPPASWTLAYFFMLPNVVFPLFPVVDFSTFRRTYYDRDAHAIYQRGLDWILRGVVHLLLYRIVYQYWTIDAADVATLGDLVQFVVSTFLLYLKVSGQFHLIVGVLHLFGFRLPETHHLFYLASSFTDFWRRINIYWKDFMTKVVFYPTYLPLRKRGETFALVVATLVVFAVTWFTHSYQWFWILGSWLLSLTDVLFWIVLAVLLVANSVYEMKRGRTRALGHRPLSARAALGIGVRTALTFSVIALLWSFWSSASVGDWLDLVAVERASITDLLIVAAVLALVVAASAIGAWLGRSPGQGERRSAAGAAMSSVPTLAGFLCLLGLPTIGGLFGPRVQGFVRDLRLPELSTRDAAAMERGYYERLEAVDLQNGELWELYAQRPARGMNIWSAGVLRETNDFLEKEMRPLVGLYHAGVTFRTNRWALRDKDYALAPPAGTYRIALLGQSYVAGDGVNDGETFENLVEERLNRDHGNRDRRYEILNFAVGSYSVLQQLMLLDRVFSFRPDALYFVATPNDADKAVQHLVSRIRAGVRPPFSFLDSLLTSTGVTSDMRETEAVRRLRPHREQVLRWAYEQMATAAKARGARPVWIYLYLPQENADSNTVAELEATARSVGFGTANLRDVYRGQDLRLVRVSPWDYHPNAVGHRLIADRFFSELTTRTDLGLPLGPTDSPRSQR